MKLYEIAKALSGDLIGDGDLTILGLSPIEDISPGFLVYADGPENLQLAEDSEALAIVVNKSITSSKKPLIRVDNVSQSFIQLLDLFYPPKKVEASIHETAVIAEDVQLGKNVSIGPFVVIESGSVLGDGVVLKSHVVIGEKVTIGAYSMINPNVTIYDHCELGQRVIIHASSVVGSDGFGYSRIGKEHRKIPHVGRVVIEDDVEIGASTVIDRATLGETRIGSGSKIDNLVQVAHSVQLGKNNIVCGFTGIAGSTTTGDNVVLAAGVGIGDHAKIDDEVIVCARAGIPPKKHLLKNNIYLGSPARPRDRAIEVEFSVTRIPYIRKKQQAMSERLDELEQRLETLEETTE